MTDDAPDKAAQPSGLLSARSWRARVTTAGRPTESDGLAALKRRIGANLRRIRDSAGLTQGDVASASGMDQSEISKIERGTDSRNVSVETMWRLSKALNVTVADLVAEDDPPIATTTPDLLLEIRRILTDVQHDTAAIVSKISTIRRK